MPMVVSFHSWTRCTAHQSAGLQSATRAFFHTTWQLKTNDFFFPRHLAYVPIQSYQSYDT